MSIGFDRVDASFCTLPLSSTPALSYTCTVLLPPPHALTSMRQKTVTMARKPFLNHGNLDRAYIFIGVFISIALPYLWSGRVTFAVSKDFLLLTNTFYLPVSFMPPLFHTPKIPISHRFSNGRDT